MKTHPPGLLALSASENSRYTTCNASREAIRRPAGSFGFVASSLSIAENWNHIVLNVLLKHADLQWIFMMNDDHIYSPDTLFRLLDHEVDVVSGLYCEKVVPFGPVLYSSVDEDGLLTRLALPNTPVSGLIKITACGDGALLVRRSVFELIDPPWWTFGAVEQDRADHDVSFCTRLREAGIDLFADLSATVDHVAPIAFRPIQQPDGSWIVAIKDRQQNAVEIQTVAAATLEGVL